MVVKEALSGMQGFDVNEQLLPNEATAFFKAGNSFCFRYIPRSADLLEGNLTTIEISTILNAGMALGVVQHCPLPGWEPSAALGKQYGDYAATYAKSIGLPNSMSIFLDLETPDSKSTPQSVIDYANAWYYAVLAGAYNPGVYVGYGAILTPEQLYHNLYFTNYWRAYNGPDVAERGYQIVQSTQKTLNGIQYDPDTISVDKKGGLPMLLYSS